MITVPPRIRITVATRVLRVIEKVTAPIRRIDGRVTTWLARKAVLRPGTRVRVNGKCCHGTEMYAGRMGTITKWQHELDDPDYHVHIEDKDYGDDRNFDGGFDYMCERGFDVVEYK